MDEPTPGTATRVGRQIVGNSAWLTGERLTRAACAMLATALLARALGPRDFGALSLASSIVILYGNFASVGLSGVVVRDLVRRPEQRHALLGTALRIRSVGGVVAVAVSVLTAVVLSDGDGSTVALTALVSVRSLFRINELVAMVHQAESQMRRPAVAGIVGAVCMVLTAVVLMLTTPPLWMFGLPYVIEMIGVTVVLRIGKLGRRRSVRGWTFDGVKAKRYLREVWPLILSGGFAVMNLRVDQLVLAAMSTTDEVGLYAAAARVSEAGYFVPTALATAVMPALVKAHRHSPTQFRERMQSAFDVTLLCGLAASVATFVLAPWLVEVLYGRAYEPAVAILQIHTWGGVFMFMRAMLSKWLIVEELTMFSLVTHGSGALLNVLLNILLIPAHGGRGAAIATVVSYAVSSYLSLYLSRRTMPAARMMSRAVFAPVRVLRRSWQIAYPRMDDA